MFILGCLRMLYLVPASWLDAFLVRKKPFEERYAHMKKWSKRIIKAFHCRVCIDAQGAIPQEGPLLFVSNHQSAFDMLLQMSIITTPFTFISKKENEKLPYAVSYTHLFLDPGKSGRNHYIKRKSKGINLCRIGFFSIMEKA